MLRRMSFFEELKRRNVVRVGLVYLIIAWLLLQISDTLAPALYLPDWFNSAVALLLILGFPLALFFAWAFELTPEGIKLEKDVDRSGSVTHLTGRKLDFAIIGLMAAAIVYLLLDSYVLEKAPPETVDIDKSIAVLPFENRSARTEDEFFVGGVHDDILTQLAKIDDLKVISRTSVMEYREQTRNLREIGQALGVATILEGGVQRAGESVRINVQLIDASSDVHLWAETYDRELTTSNIFAIQSEIATAIADALKARMSPGVQKSIAGVPTQNLQAYDLFQRANAIIRSQSWGTSREAAQLYENALLLDPDFALARAYLARIYVRWYWYLEPDDAHLLQARAMIDMALERQPDLPEAHVALADYFYRGFLEYDRALEQLDIATPLAPRNANTYGMRAFILRRRGDLGEAIPYLERAVELDPLNSSLHYGLAGTYFMLGRFDVALSYYDRAVELVPNDFSMRVSRAHALLELDPDSPAMRQLMTDPAFAEFGGRVWMQYKLRFAMREGDYDFAMDLIRHYESESTLLQSGGTYSPTDLLRALTEFYSGEEHKSTAYFESAKSTLESAAIDMPDDPRILRSLGFAYAGLGDRENALAAAAKAAEILPVSRDALRGPEYVKSFAQTYAMLGEPDAAIEKLEQLLSRPVNWTASLSVVRREPAFAELHEMPAFQALLEKHRFRD